MRPGRFAVALGSLLAASGCDGAPSRARGVVDGALVPCPPMPNCIRTGSPEAPNLRLPGDDPAAWSSFVDAVAAMPRTVIVSRADGYVHAEVRTRVFRFVDDLELYHLPESSEVQVRSAARSGAWDLGVNARRVDRLRKLAGSS